MIRSAPGANECDDTERWEIDGQRGGSVRYKLAERKYKWESLDKRRERDESVADPGLPVAEGRYRTAGAAVRSLEADLAARCQCGQP